MKRKTIVRLALAFLLVAAAVVLYLASYSVVQPRGACLPKLQAPNSVACFFGSQRGKAGDGVSGPEKLWRAWLAKHRLVKKQKLYVA